MKKLTVICILVLTVAFAVMAFAETGLNYNQPMSPAYNPRTTVTKTAAYTLTTSDDYVKVTNSSADITITLPAISSLTKSQRYKILKTDATTYDVIVTPATGDTIGGGSTRYLISQNAYMLIKSGANNNWIVEYESPYIVEDHEAGTFTTGIGSGGAYSSVTVSTTLTASDCGKVYSAATGTLQMDLPSTVANCEFTFVNAVGGAGSLKINPADADQIFGGCTLAASVVSIAGAAGDSVNNTTGTAIKGDFIRLRGSGTAATGWWITGCQGIWADTN